MFLSKVSGQRRCRPQPAFHYIPEAPCLQINDLLMDEASAASAMAVRGDWTTRRQGCAWVLSKRGRNPERSTVTPASRNPCMASRKGHSTGPSASCMRNAGACSPVCIRANSRKRRRDRGLRALGYESMRDDKRCVVAPKASVGAIAVRGQSGIASVLVPGGTVLYSGLLDGGIRH